MMERITGWRDWKDEQTFQDQKIEIDIQTVVTSFLEF